MKEKKWIAHLAFDFLDGRGVLHKMEDKMERLKRLSRLFVLITCLCGLSIAQAQVTDTTNLKGKKEQSIFDYFKKFEQARNDSLKKIEQWGEQRTMKLFSKILNEERSFLVSIPKGYNDSMKKFPVLYRLDGDAEQLYDMYQKIEAMVFKQQAPEMILVSIKNANPAGFRYEYKMYPEYGHCPEPSLVDGLKWLKKAVSSDVEYLFNSTHPYISPDKSYIVFDVFDNNGISDLYVSLEMKHWNEGIKLDPEINATRLRHSMKCAPI